MPSCRALLALAFVCAGAPATAQDPFEIQVYEYATVPRRKYDLEMHFNHTFKGEVQSHLTFEFTRGITDYFETGVYVLTSSRPGVVGEFAGLHIRPRFRLPEGMLPVKFSLSSEFGFPQVPFETAKMTLELRPIFEWRWGSVDIDVNPTLGKVLRGPGSDSAWDFEPSARLGLPEMGKWQWSLEYFGGMGEITKLDPVKAQRHQFYPGFDYNYSDTVILNAGVGFGATSAGNQIMAKMRLGWIFP